MVTDFINNCMGIDFNTRPSFRSINQGKTNMSKAEARRMRKQAKKERKAFKAKRDKKQSFVQEIEASGAYRFRPMNRKQQDLIDAITHCQIVAAVGAAGTGKTMVAAYTAAKLLLKNESGIEEIIISRPNQGTGKTMGHLPGTVEEKLAPYLAPLTKNLSEALGSGRYENYVSSGKIKVQPLEMIRGMSFENSVIIIDESQNLNMDELKAISTRVGENSVVVFCGDPAQSDVKKGYDLERFVKLCEKNGIEMPVVRFEIEDIVRSGIVRDLCEMFYKEGI